jgi:phosphopantetheinyl transferase
LADSRSNEPNGLSRDFSLSDREVHVWTLDIGVERRPWDHVLSRDELEAASRMTGEHGLRFKNCRAALRLVLGKYLLKAPNSLQFSFGPHGKPYISTDSIHFNVSHSSNVLVIAVAQKLEVGVDIEVLRKIDDLRAIATQFFEPWEIERLTQIDSSSMDRAFLQIWVRKEAILKAAGIGLADGLTVTPPFQEELQGATTYLQGHTGNPFYLYDLAGESEFVGAVATHEPAACIIRKTATQEGSHQAMLFNEPSA